MSGSTAQLGGSSTTSLRAPGELARPAALVATDLVKRFGGLDAVQNVGFHIAPGEVLGILGPNGAGKSTLINIVSGAFQANAGRVLLDGEDITGLDMAGRARRGLVRTFQNTRPSEELSAREILRLAAQAPKGTHEARMIFRPSGLIDLFGLGPFADARHSSLPYGFQKIVLLAATALCQPRVLFLDEPFQGVSDAELERLAAVIRQFQSAGVAIGLVEHNVRSVMALCERIIVLDAGKMIFSGPAQAALRDEAVQVAYLGARFAKPHG
jgi:branched-chain amino acid transport system ATP-binding protein